MTLLLLCREALMDHTPQNKSRVDDPLQELTSKLPGVVESLKKFQQEGSKKSPTFLYWTEYISMVNILLKFVRAEREGCCELHLHALELMIPYLFCYDRVNYARWASIYYEEMKLPPRTAPEVYL